MSNHDHNHNPHVINMKSVRKPVNQPRSGAINTMQEVINSTQMQLLMQQTSNNYCCTASAESSTGSPAQHNIVEPLRTASNNSNNPYSALITNRSATLHLKLKKARPRDSIANDSAGLNLCSSNYSVVSTAINPPVISSKIKGNEEAKLVISASDQEKGAVVVVCSMCGDVGIAELLFVCSKCSHRHQHIYCSRLYPNTSEAEASICNWCLHAADARVAKASGASTNKIEEESTPSMERDRPVMSLVHGDTPSQLGDHVMKDEEDDVMVKKGHSKAFEYLLLVAAQSLPQDNQVISSANPAERRQDDRTTSTTTSKRDALPVDKGISNTVMSKTNTTPLVNIVNMGPATEAAKTNTSLIKNTLSMGLNTNENTRIHRQLQISIDHKSDMDVGRFIGGGIPKRQRCSKGITASLKCRKKGLQLSPSRPNYRRYKLLADVVC